MSYSARIANGISPAHGGQQVTTHQGGNPRVPVTSTAGPDVVRKNTRDGERIRVAYCIDNMRPGGTELNAVRTVERLDRSRFEVSVICLQESGPLAARYSNAGVPVVSLPIPNLYGLRMIRQGIRLARFLSQNNIQIVHSHDVYDNVFATIWARVARTPVVIASRRWWRTYPPRVHRIANAFAFRLAHCVLANSTAVALSLQNEDGVQPDRIAVVPNFVDDAAFTPFSPEERTMLRCEFGVPGDALLVGIVASLYPVKDHATLIRAVALLAPRWPQLQLMLVGDGECRAGLEALAQSLSVRNRVHFVGSQPNDPNLHHLFDISVLCSVSEGFPNSVVEAMAAARPLVATDVGGIADAVVHGVTGLLVPASHPERLAAALEDLLADPARRQALGSAGRDRARDRYHAASVIRSLEALYEKLVAMA